jgi:hypothetical protein
MANFHRDERRSYRRRASYSEWANEHGAKSSGKERVALDSEPEIPGVRRIRIEREDERCGETHQAVSPTKMAPDSYATLLSEESTSSHRRRRRHHRSPEEESHRRRAPNSRDESPATYLYGTPSRTSRQSRATESETRRLESEDETSDVEEVVGRRSETKHESPSKRKVRVVYITEEDYHSSKRKERAQRGERRSRDTPKEEDIVRRSRTHRSQRRSVAEPATASPPKR